MSLWSPPRIFEGEDVWIIGGGPSLKGFNPRLLRGRRAIAVNCSYRLVPDADVLYWGDQRWWARNKSDAMARFRGRFKVTRKQSPDQGVDAVGWTSRGGWSDQPGHVAGRDSGCQAINLAAQMGARRIFLLGFDMQPVGGENNWHDLHPKREHPSPEHYAKAFLPGYHSVAQGLCKLGIDCYNCCPGSALEEFPKVSMSEALRIAGLRWAVATTCHADGWEQYGRRMAESFDARWPRSVELLLYAEGFEPDLDSDRIRVFDLERACPSLVEFKRRWGSNEKANGRKPDRRWPTQTVKGRPYQFRLDAVKFANKSFAAIEAARTTDADRLVWMDADTVTHSDVDTDALDELLDAGAYIGLLERDGCYPECGLYLVDLTHPSHEHFFSAFEQLYLQDQFLGYEEWHDSYLIDRLVQEFEAEGAIRRASLSGRGSRTNHPLANGPLSRWFDHLKGSWKTLARSPKGSVRTPEPAAHWS